MNAALLLSDLCQVGKELLLMIILVTLVYYYFLKLTLFGNIVYYERRKLAQFVNIPLKYVPIKVVNIVPTVSRFVC